MPNDKKLPATIPTNSALPREQPSSLVSRGLAAVQQSLAAPKEEDAETFSLARLYLFGDYLDQDLALAERMLLNAANKGNLDSQRELASEYTSGKRLKRNTTAALHWLMMAEQNSASSKLWDQYQLGNFYQYYADDAPNYVEAIKWYRKAADEGYYRSQESLGRIYEFGKGMPKDYVQAFKWYLLSAANSPTAMPAHKTLRHRWPLGPGDVLGQKMTAAQRAESRKLARAWMDQFKPRHWGATDYKRAREGLERAS